MQARTWPVNASDADDMGIATRAEQDACPSTNIPKTPFFEAVEAIEEEEAHRVSKLADDWAKDNSGTTAMEYLLSATESIWEVVGSGRDPLEVKDQVDADLLAVRSFFDDGGSAVRSAAQAMKTEVGTLSTDEDARDYAKGIKKEKAKNPRTIDWPADSA
jgi:hypothetical protein